MQKKLALVAILLLSSFSTVAHGAVVEVSCGSNPQFTNSCNQCFTETTKIYLGSGTRNLSDTWFSGAAGTYIYPDENTSPVNIRAFYTNGELQQGAGGFGWSTNLSDGNANNGEFFRDGAGSTFIKFTPNTSGKILSSDSSYFIKFANLSQSVINNGRNFPLWETQYTINYYNIGNWTKTTHKECVLNYPAWCGDGVVDAGKETCDFNDPNKTGWGPGGCNQSCQPITTPVCNAGVTGTQTSPISASTANLCANTGETVVNFTSSASGNTTNYVWNCTDGTNTYTGGNCSANYTPPVSPVCNAGVTGTQTSPISASTANLCANTGETVVNFTSSVSGNTTNYVWNCTNGTNTYTGGNCSANYTTGGGGSSCLNGPITGNQSSPVSPTNPGLCQTGLSVGNFASNVIGNTTYYSWSCGGISGGGCYANYTGGGGGGSSSSSSSSSGGGGSSSSGGGGSKNYCGDGRVQRPNDDQQYEECDFGNETDWLYCNRDCTYTNNTIPGHCQDNGSCEITIPNGGAMIFGPKDNVIIGAGMNPYTAHGLSRPFIRNESDYDLYFDQICVVKKTGSTLIGATDCREAGIIHAGQTKYYPTTPDFRGANVTTGNYGDNTIITTIKHKGVRYDNAYFISILDVRVAKSSVATTGGGTSYLGNTTSVGNISDVAKNGQLNPDKNKNFVGVGVSGGDISSYSNDVTDSGSVDTISKLGDKYSQSIKQVSDTEGTAIGDTKLLSDFESYNGIENVSILKNKNFIVESGTFTNVKGSRTYIIENGNLKINANIVYPDNIAFVVKGGNIQVYKDVTQMDGTYVTIAKDGVGGKFQAIGGTTFENKLNVNGSLYGNINNLIANRTYVKQNSSNQIDVGTIVSFGSKLFRKPAPLISTFINEYLQSEKISK
ncbi:MAG: hypothetical protein PHS49_01090 [Candidatus Gracilibacteria bacterium]|nr:hypothetical protein [Candidatus Gracilibacteria bacterium]